ncbi:hypothetical protein ACS0TY_002452 [Phlomoides rotata]
MRKLLPGTNIVANPHINSKLHIWKKDYGALSDLLSKSGIGWNSTTCTLNIIDEVVWDEQKRTMRYKSWPYYENWLDIFRKDKATDEHAADPNDLVNSFLRNSLEEEGENGTKIGVCADETERVAGDTSVCKPSGPRVDTSKGRKERVLQTGAYPLGTL